MPDAAKPHLRMRYGVWSCATFNPFAVGCGYTPAQAYDEWVRFLFAPAHHPV